jgi:hypothetical protein
VDAGPVIVILIYRARKMSLNGMARGLNMGAADSEADVLRHA